MRLHFPIRSSLQAYNKQKKAQAYLSANVHAAWEAQEDEVRKRICPCISKEPQPSSSWEQLSLPFSINVCWIWMKEKNGHITTSSDSSLGQAWVRNETMPLELATSLCCEQNSFCVPFSKIKPQCQHLPQITICQSQFAGRWKSLGFSVTHSGFDNSLSHSSCSSKVLGFTYNNSLRLPLSSIQDQHLFSPDQRLGSIRMNCRWKSPDAVASRVDCWEPNPVHTPCIASSPFLTTTLPSFQPVTIPTLETRLDSQCLWLLTWISIWGGRPCPCTFLMMKTQSLACTLAKSKCPCCLLHKTNPLKVGVQGYCIFMISAQCCLPFLILLFFDYLLGAVSLKTCWKDFRILARATEQT